MAFSNGYVFGFATACCVVCSLGVSSAAIGLKDKQAVNRTRDMQSSILNALELPEDEEEPEEALSPLPLLPLAFLPPLKPSPSKSSLFEV